MKKFVEKTTVSFSANFSRIPWLQRLALWFFLKKLECQLWSSRRFQNYCQKIGCKSLAELEGQVGEQIHGQIERLKTSFENKGLASKKFALNETSDGAMADGSEIDKPQPFKRPTLSSQLSTKSFPLNTPIPKPQPK